MAASPQPDPSAIGGIPQARFALLPDPGPMFRRRSERFGFLAQSSRLAPYLRFLAALSVVQADLCAGPIPAPLPAARLAQARAGQMPPIDRAALAGDPALDAMLSRLCTAAEGIEMPEPARLALSAVVAADAADRRWLLTNILSDTIPEDSAAPHLFAAAAVQVHMARLAATLDPKALQPVGTGLCPACGGRPASSSVLGAQGVENLRYAACACCSSQWNAVRVTCLCCGSTKGISYRSVETAEATVKAEVCGECKSWVKILYQVKNASLDPVADDVGSLGLDMKMRDTGFRRGGFNPFLAGV